MNINKSGIIIDQYMKYKLRYCEECNNEYRIVESIYQDDTYLYPPVKYFQGCEEYCLSCWLCINPENVHNTTSLKNKSNSIIQLEYPDNHEHWYDIQSYEEIDLGNLELAYKEYMREGFHLAILPISRLATERSIFLPYGTMIYPEGRINISGYNCPTFRLVEKDYYPHPEELSQNELSLFQTHLSGVSISDLNNYPLVIMPVKFDWKILENSTHEEQLAMIYKISDKLNSLCLNFLRYNFCTLSYQSNNQLPANASQTLIKNMSAILLINSGQDKSKFIAGEVFPNQITKGLGLGIKQPEWIAFPSIEGEMGKLVNHAISLYIQMIETSSATNKFVQALSLLEFLVFPYEYKQFKEVKKRVARYITSDTTSQEYKKILDRFEELTGKKDENTKEIIGYRTQIVHLGKKIEDLLPVNLDRKMLFIELDDYIRNIIDDMIKKSFMTESQYYNKK